MGVRSACAVSALWHGMDGACRRAAAYADGDPIRRRDVMARSRSGQGDSLLPVMAGRQKELPGMARLKEARRAAVCARSSWVFLHVVLFAAAASPGTELHAAFVQADVWYLTATLGMLAVNALVYATVSVMDPGYQQARSRPQSRRQSTDNLPEAVEGKASTMRGNDWLLDTVLEREHALDSCESNDDVRKKSGLTLNARRAMRMHDGPSLAAVLADVPNMPSVCDKGRTCAYCDAWQPLRAKHCHDCDRCVRLFDHHCVWIGNCVGVKNYRLFFLYLVTQTLCIMLGLKVMASGLSFKQPRTVRMARHHGIAGSGIDKWVGDHLPLLAGIGLLLLLGVFLLTLLVYHTYLVATNQTTYENLKEGKQVPYYLKDTPPGSTPFNKGCVTNCKLFFLQWRSWGEENELPPLSHLHEAAGPKNTFWDNKYYSCFD